MSDDPPEITVTDLLAQHVGVRMAALAEQRLLIDTLFPPPQLTRWQRRRCRLANAVAQARENVALLIAPWLRYR